MQNIMVPDTTESTTVLVDTGYDSCLSHPLAGRNIRITLRACRAAEIDTAVIGTHERQKINYQKTMMYTNIYVPSWQSYHMTLPCMLDMLV